jgi:hypothetical protein
MIEEIHFNENNPPLLFYENLIWSLNETRLVEFFPQVVYQVKLISVNSPELYSSLQQLETSNPIAIDLEWEDELCLFQFCSSYILIIQHPSGPGNSILCEFLLTHKFYGKGTRNDKKMLFQKFSINFDNIEDIAITRLIPYGHSQNFQQMTLDFAGKPSAEFKDVRITTSN